MQPNVFHVLYEFKFRNTACNINARKSGRSVRTALTAVRAFMPSPAEGAVGSLDYSKEERRKLAERRETESQKQQVMERLAPCQQLLMLGSPARRRGSARGTSAARRAGRRRASPR